MKYKATDDDKHEPDAHSEKDGHDADAHAGDSHGEHAEIDPADWSVQNSMDYYLDPSHLIGHVQDSDHFELPSFLAGSVDFEKKGKIEIPHIPFLWSDDEPFMGENGVVFDVKPNQFIGPATFQPTKFIILELIGALIICAVFIPYARRIKNGDRPQGRFWNLIDTMVCYVRDEIALPSIGSADAKRFYPFIWTIFFFVLVLNLLGMVPGLGAATGSISVTAALALAVFFVVMGTGHEEDGCGRFFESSGSPS